MWDLTNDGINYRSLNCLARFLPSSMKGECCFRMNWDDMREFRSLEPIRIPFVFPQRTRIPVTLIQQLLKKIWINETALFSMKKRHRTQHMRPQREQFPWQKLTIHHQVNRYLRIQNWHCHLSNLIEIHLPSLWWLTSYIGSFRAVPSTKRRRQLEPGSDLEAVKVRLLEAETMWSPSPKMRENKTQVHSMYGIFPLHLP